MITGVIALAAVYALVLGRATTADLLTALVVAVGVRIMVHRFLRATAGSSVSGSPTLAWRVLMLPWFALGVGLEVVKGTIAVMAVVLGRPARPGVVEVRLYARTPGGVLAGMLALTLSPGSVVIDVDEARRRVRLHVINAADPTAVRTASRRFYRRYQRAVFP
jgi:multisubunit Na+/H+ antiporter MnhE subunit